MSANPTTTPVLRLKVHRRFCAGAVLHQPAWSEERNRATYGVCANPHGHGHDYRLTVTVEGQLDAATGLVFDYAALIRLVDERLIEPVDHKHLNQDVDFLRGLIPTSENLLVKFWERLAPALPAGLRLLRMDLAEAEDCSCSYQGPAA